MKTQLFAFISIVLCGAVAVCLAADRLNLSVVIAKVGTTRTRSGNRAHEILIKTQQAGGRMIGRIEVYVQVTDKDGKTYFGSTQFTQSEAIRRETARTESIYLVSFGMMDSPRVTGVWARYVNTDDGTNLAEARKDVSATKLEDWIASNSASERISVEKDYYTFTR